MLGTVGRTALEGMRDGVQEVRRGGRALGKMGIPSPSSSRSWGVPPTWLSVLLAAAAVLGFAAVLYLRKRRQVAEHYKMGGAWEAAGAGNTETFHA
jgi:hypothetical protein